MKHFVAKIYIDNQLIESLGFKGKLFGINLFQDPWKCDMAVIDLWNSQKTFLDSNIIRERAILDIWLGIGGPLKYMGRYILQKPKFGFPEKNAPIIRLIGLDESSKLKEKGEKRNQFSNMLDSDIVTSIAAEYGLITDITPTLELRNQESQLNETDLELVARLAHRNGYLFYVEDGTLHFHPIRFENTNIALNYGNDEKNALFEFWPEKNLLRTASQFHSSFLDRDSGELVTNISKGTPDIIETQDKARYPDYKSLKELLIQRPTKYEQGIRNLFSFPSVDAFLKTREQDDSRFVVGWGKATGNPKITARKIITLKGLGHLSGYYYIESASHIYDDVRGYIVEFIGTKSRVGPLRAIPSSVTKGDQTTQINPGQEIQPEIINEVNYD